jgi:hypothetical protein
MLNQTFATEKLKARDAYQALIANHKLTHPNGREGKEPLKSGNTVYPSGFQKWIRHIRHELAYITAYLSALELTDSYDEAVAMEGLGLQVLEILNKNN